MSPVAAVVDAAAARLRAAGFTADDARRDALVLARAVLGWSQADWIVHARSDGPQNFATTFDALISRRAAFEPVAHLLGEREFYGRMFRVTADTLIPRPETEDLVTAALEWIAGHHGSAPLRVLDVGTGTGCVAITLALECAPGRATIAATDISPAALTIARDNAMRLGANSVTFTLGHLLADHTAPFDLIVSNPPYVPERDRETLQPDVRRFEPATALFSGDDGLDLIRELVPVAKRALVPGGALMLEIGQGQAAEVDALLRTSGFTMVNQRPDLQGIPRIIVATSL
jgi:release factor glutamine methyltransferase